MSQFDPKLFLDQQHNEANSTVRIPIPVGEYLAVIEKVDTRSWQKRTDASVNGIALDVTYMIDDAGVKSLLGRDKVTITQGIMLDLTPTGGLDYSKGRNVELGRLREAVGLNVAGQPFSFRMLEGRPLKVAVSHRPNDERPGEVFSNVSGTVKAA